MDSSLKIFATTSFRNIRGVAKTQQTSKMEIFAEIVKGLNLRCLIGSSYDSVLHAVKRHFTG